MVTNQASDIRSKIKKIKVHTKRIMQSTLSGDYVSAFKGSGLEFDQIREYSIGDDVRLIDWNSSAKMNEIMIKQYIQERDRTIILVVDNSLSFDYGSGTELKRELASNVAACLAFIAEFHRDKVGALFFTDRVESWIEPKRGRMHVGSIVQKLFTASSHGKRTKIDQALRFLIGLKMKNAIVFFVSDWIDDIQTKSNLLKVASVKYDFVGVRITDPAEGKIPDVGLLDVCDRETDEMITVDTAHKEVNVFMAARLLQQKKLFEKYRIDLLDLSVGHPFINSLASFFHRRIRRQI